MRSPRWRTRGPRRRPAEPVTHSHDAAGIALVTSAVGLPRDPDLPLAVAALEDAGFAADVVRWDDPDVEWDGYALSVVRSCWDYTRRRDEFLAWAARVPGCAIRRSCWPGTPTRP